MNEPIKKKEGFKGQKAIVIPRPILVGRCARNHIINTLYITDIGYYPKAEHHYRERPNGADQHILIYCHEGRGKVQFHKKEYSIEAGDYCFIPLKVPHSYAADNLSPWTIYWAHFKGKSADNIVNELLKANRLKGFIRNSSKCIILFSEIYSKFESGYGSDSMQYANMVFWNLLATVIWNNECLSQDKFLERDVIELSLEYMKKNTAGNLSLTDIAREAGLSDSHFSMIFKKRTGFSPIAFFNHLKVQLACQYLMFTDMRIKEISRELGIEDQYYFSRLFTKVMGLSPNQYREKKEM